ncbi:hypothetical protein DMUE_4774 [Dictyocoela muelleri]|nr:hypothetical protein DMUE_4774 [Dictyocoela muelleri]
MQPQKFFLNNNRESNYNEHNNPQGIFKSEESLLHNINKKKTTSNRGVDRMFFCFIPREILLSEMSGILNIYYVQQRDCTKDILATIIKILLKFKTQSEKKSATKKILLLKRTLYLRDKCESDGVKLKSIYVKLYAFISLTD